MTYLNCPVCHLSIEHASAGPCWRSAPGAARERGYAQPVFRSRLPWRELGAPTGRIGDESSLGPRRGASRPQGRA